LDASALRGDAAHGRRLTAPRRPDRGYVLREPETLARRPRSGGAGRQAERLLAGGAGGGGGGAGGGGGGAPALPAGPRAPPLPPPAGAPPRPPPPPASRRASLRRPAADVWRRR